MRHRPHQHRPLHLLRGPMYRYCPTGKVIVPSRTVPRNEFGYPIANPNGVDVGRITTRNNQDEDGVGSV